MEYTFRYTRNADGWYSGQCEQVPEAISQAPTLHELQENIADAISLVFQARREQVLRNFNGSKSTRRKLHLA
ncbi:MAG: type II toxin-antitoxin system HicB family antitoxin [Bacteroidales bacterium]|jgi:predicted RNase H-like HicB family nuclease|nr:type II toxin-antitoxin system HicB family antitoxin [Bacteroidales bacterium]